MNIIVHRVHLLGLVNKHVMEVAGANTYVAGPGTAPLVRHRVAVIMKLVVPQDISHELGINRMKLRSMFI
jgi:hypothetical protein